eukprot:jgi/Tetstr1/431892/TSEL_021381.t1
MLSSNSSDYGAAIGSQPVAREPPARASVLVGSKPHQYVEVAFPWELNNTDYLRRVLGQVTLALRPLYGAAVTRGGCVKVRTGDHHEVEARQADAFYILKHLLENPGYYSEELNMDPEAVEDHAYCLRSARNRLAHEEDDLQGVSWKDLAAAFASAKALAAGARCAFATTNLVRLRRQCEEHAQSKELRRQGQPTRVSIAALTPELADEGPPPFLAQAGAGQERKCREWYADNANEWGNGPLQLRTREAETPLAGGDGAVEPWQPRILARGAAAPSEGPPPQEGGGGQASSGPPARPRQERPSAFQDLKLQKGLLEGILACGLHEPSAIEHYGIKALRRGYDVGGEATGQCRCQALLLTASREEGELAQAALSALGGGLDGSLASSHACGSGRAQDVAALQAGGAAVVIGTPEHVRDMLKAHVLHTSSVKMLVLEDVDEMLQCGFKEAMYDVFHLLQPPKLLTRKPAAGAAPAPSAAHVQLAVTCTSMPAEVQEIVRRFATDPVHINLLTSSRPHPKDAAAQFYLVARSQEEKLESLRACHALLERGSAQGVVFVSSWEEADWISSQLQERHGIVVSLAQLLDELSMLLAINYDLPDTAEDYMQRIKCCKGASAAAINLISSREDERMLQHVESLFNFSVNELPSSFLSVVLRHDGSLAVNNERGVASSAPLRPGTVHVFSKPWRAAGPCAGASPYLSCPRGRLRASQAGWCAAADPGGDFLVAEIGSRDELILVCIDDDGERLAREAILQVAAACGFLAPVAVPKALCLDGGLGGRGSEAGTKGQR